MNKPTKEIVGKISELTGYRNIVVTKALEDLTERTLYKQVIDKVLVIEGINDKMSEEWFLVDDDTFNKLSTN